jgi:hypothetical protein
MRLYGPDADNATAPFVFATSNSWAFRCDSTDVLTLTDSYQIETASGSNITVNGNITANLYHSTLDTGYARVRYGSGTLVDLDFRESGGNLQWRKNGGTWMTITDT